jgi:hypothetical protein
MHWHNPGQHLGGFVKPCLPTISRTVPTGPQWVYEIKHDGFRFLAVRHRKQVRHMQLDLPAVDGRKPLQHLKPQIVPFMAGRRRIPDPFFEFPKHQVIFERVRPHSQMVAVGLEVEQ